MSYKTYNNQILEHLQHLQSKGLDVTELISDSSNWIRCHAIGKTLGRGELAYITTTERLNNGFLGIKTSYRGINGSGSFKTYGQWPDGSEGKITSSSSVRKSSSNADNSEHEQAARKAYGFWNHSNIQGKSDYLNRKGVGYYGIRFRTSEEYGNVAVVPMLDGQGKLWNYQLLNPDGSKRMSKDGRTEGLFHKLKEPVNGKPIGISEGYVTAATCLELSSIATVCAFSSENLVHVAKVIRHIYPESPLIIFADNDRHLVEKGSPNKGLLKAHQSRDAIDGYATIAIPGFNDLEPSKDASDWNDLVRLKGIDEAKRQIMTSCGTYANTIS